MGETSTATNTPAPTTTPTFSPTPTEVPREALPVEEIVQKYLTGEIDDVSVLNFEQQKTFSIALNEKKNEQRGANPVIYTDQSGAKFYIDPITGKFLPVDNGTTAKEQTIEMYLPRVVDNEGYTHIFQEGEWIKIAGSQNIQFDDFENFPWPDTEIIDPQWVSERNKDLLGLTSAEFSFKSKDDGGPRSMIPIIILSKELGEMNISGFGNTGALTIYLPNKNSSYSTNRAILTGNMPLFGDNLAARSSGKLIESSPFWQELEENSLYYLIFYNNQKAIIAKNYPDSGGAEITSPYSGLAPTDSTYELITGQTDSQEMVWIQGKMLIKAGQ